MDDDRTVSARSACVLATVVVTVIAVTPAARAQDAPGIDVPALEAAIAADPENLEIAADYRQALIGQGAFDRSIDFFKRLARRRSTGPNIHISLALAYVDKVPGSGDLRRIFLARDALGELDKAIARQPDSLLAYYVRGVINLYFNRAIFKRLGRGIADLERARGMIDAAAPPAVVARVFLSLGDGYWKDDRQEKAREIWQIGLTSVPGHSGLASRLVSDPEVTRRLVNDALNPGTRVDTSLVELFPRTTAAQADGQGGASPGDAAGVPDVAGRTP